jgi:3'(2'), 5'-bisphosphate nucleotidase
MTGDAELARCIAEAAGAALLELRATGAFEGKELGDAGDRAANLLILDALAGQRPEDCVLSEESADDKTRCGQRRVWIVDPLDGTREYSEGRADWAVHIGLSIDGVAAVGAVALPSLGLTLTSAAPPALKPTRDPPRMLVSRTRPAAEAVAVARAIGAELVPMGSAGAKAMAVVLGEAEIYLHSGGQYAWDSCAPAAVALAAGLHVSHLDGTPLVYNREDSYLGDLLICRREYAERILGLVAEGIA